MQIINYGRGVHQREVVGVDRLKALPPRWYAFTNLDLALAPGKTREIDVIIVADDRIFLVDLKDWHGKIESSGGNWLQNDRDRGPSPVGKIHQNAKEVAQLLSADVRRRARGGKVTPPKVIGLVVVTTKADLSGISATETSSVVTIDQFVQAVTSPASRVRTFGPVAPTFVADPLTAQNWKQQLSKFFNVQTGPFKPGNRRYGNFIATSQAADFEHPSKVYAEFESMDENSARSLATLRVWDFSKAETRFQSEEGRREIVGREREVIGYLRDRSEEADLAILNLQAEDPDRGVRYWEVFDRRRRLRRLSDFALVESKDLARDQRLELARQLIAKVDLLHRADAAHLDIGGHSVWLQQPSTVRLSHLMAASYPQVRSLGDQRYHFLASAKTPEDVFGGAAVAKRKDVYLLGLTVHQIIFGRVPKVESDDMPGEWSSDIDTDGNYMELHPWFQAALALVPTDRFADATAALDAFNTAISSKSSAKEVVERLERHRGQIRSQMQLFSLYPPTDTIRDDERLSIWTSIRDGRKLFIKMWKRAAWGDQSREGPRILDFLDRACDLMRSPLPGCLTIHDVIWLGDAIVLIHDWVEAKDLAERELDGMPPEVILGFIKTLCVQVVTLHESGFAHGDLKPHNILIRNEDGPLPLLADVLDFSATDDGEIQTTAYAPPEGGRFERDRFAVTKIAEELLSQCALEPEVAAAIANSISTCRTHVPRNGTLLPLLEAVEQALMPPIRVARPVVRISMVRASTGAVLPDEGKIFVRNDINRRSIILRGICEEIVVDLDVSGKPVRGRRRTTNQRAIAAVSKFEFMSIAADLEVVRSDINDFAALDVLFNDPVYIAACHKVDQSPRSDPSSGQLPLNEEAPSEQDEDALVERIAAEPSPDGDVNIRVLWRKLIDAEGELKTEGIALADSSYRRDFKRHVVPFELDIGSFEFQREDRVLVQRLDAKGRWRGIGHLDATKSRPDLIAIDSATAGMPTHARLVEEDQRLRFESSWAITSLKRRESATSRVLSFQSRIPTLVDLFDARSGSEPTLLSTNYDPSEFERSYELNKAQAQALADLLRIRPLGLLQGPPGTGKTVFISALVHFALTKGLAQNVLLASQSHEAVNGAAEAVLKLFAKDDTTPSMLRVGNEGVVSDKLLPFHVTKVEQLYKDRFSGSMKERLRIVGRGIGVDPELVDELFFIESAIRPVAEKIASLRFSASPDVARIEGLSVTLQRQLGSLGLHDTSVTSTDGGELVTKIVDAITRRANAGQSVSPDKVMRLRSVAELARDFVSSVSTEQRNFEAFLAGTRQVVSGTCVGLGRASLGLTTTTFDLVIVDEAARCTASELLVPIQSGRWVVLVGDQAQLEPQHHADVVEGVAKAMSISTREVSRSDFDRIFGTRYGERAGRTLTKQYRMLPPIGRMVSSTFYRGVLDHGRTTPELDVASLPMGLEKPLTWIETDTLGAEGFEASPKGSTSRKNFAEADLISEMARQWDQHDPFRAWLKSQDKFSKPIGIICTYADQRDLLRKKILSGNLSEELRAAIKIDTVDSYQGKENPIVIVSLVRNNAEGPYDGQIRTIKPGFLSRDNRINVAVSRAMDRLVIVGAKSRWRNDGPMARLVAAFGKEEESGEAVTLPGATLRTDRISDQSEHSPRRQPPRNRGVTA